MDPKLSLAALVLQGGIAKRDGVSISGGEANVTRNGATEKLDDGIAAAFRCERPTGWDRHRVDGEVLVVRAPSTI